MELKHIIKKVLQEESKPRMLLKESALISENLDYHLKNGISLTESVFRIYSTAFYDLVNEVRELREKNSIAINPEDLWLVNTDFGKTAILEDGREVYLDVPFLIEEEFLIEAKHRGKNVKLNSPFRTPGGPKKFAVYVKSPGGNIKKVTFGDPNLRVRNRNKAAAKSFRARHKCSQKKDRTTAGYWSCNVGRYAKKLGLKSSSSW